MNVESMKTVNDTRRALGFGVKGSAFGDTLKKLKASMNGKKH